MARRHGDKQFRGNQFLMKGAQGDVNRRRQDADKPGQKPE